MSPWFMMLCQSAVIAIALIGGAFLVFSDFLMRSLAKADGGMDVMQTINREVFRVVFMALFLGLTAVSAGLAAYAVLALTGADRVLIAAAAATYLLGVFGVTAAFNVPLNRALAAKRAGSIDGAAFWTTRSLTVWTRWNTVRTAACVLSAGLLALSLTLSATGPGS